MTGTDEEVGVLVFFDFALIKLELEILLMKDDNRVLNPYTACGRPTY